MSSNQYANEPRTSVSSSTSDSFQPVASVSCGVLSSEVRDDNPYSRLMALSRMGVVQDYARIRDFTVVVIGLGGIGSVASEMLTRCGIGKLILFDYDTVELANMNRLFYTPNQRGLTKVDAAKQTLGAINPDTEVEGFNVNICTNGYDLFTENVNTGSRSKKKVDLVLSCVDNFGARVTISEVCTKWNVLWMNSGVAEHAMSGQIQTCVPGKTACFQCAPPHILATAGDEKNLKKEGVCAASLPTTMGVIAGLLVQNALKYLLSFGEVSWYLGYNSFEDFFSKMCIQPNEECVDQWCIRRQKEHHESGEIFPPPKRKPTNEENAVHETNEFEISVVDEGAGSVETNKVDFKSPQKADTKPNDLRFKTLEDLEQQLRNL